ncbi:Na+/H+ antiporter NhaC family protein [Bacillus massiliigorillae]|uniref:Na+/H+ antiporter NhaC family protein n=1 Tax=Bacillus massiliigorillae TaxID=1243664 RepID=UPI0003A3F619|nr:Na+/H+ antiporter NhaC family protein [Bacillus massiliigorillae]
MENTIFSLLPPLVAIIMVLLTKRVLLSLGLGSITAAFLLADFNVMDSLSILVKAFTDLFYVDGELNTGKIYILLFLLLLGCVTAFVTISGGSRAFGEWALKRVKTRAGAQLTAAVLGIIIFIDDYFNSLAVGQISRPLTDRNRVSRAKLAYIIDSTAAPICVVSPVSSWGAYIIAILAPILAANSLDMSGFSAFIQMIPMNFYVWASLLLVFISSWKNINFGSMKVHEDRAITTGVVSNPDKIAPGELKSDLPMSKKGSVADLLIPIAALVVGTVSAMLWTGSKAVEGRATILQMFENTDVPTSLFYGGLFGFAVTLVLFLRQVYAKKAVKSSLLTTGLFEGIKSMLPAVYILIFAWVIVDLVGALETGSYLAGFVEKSNLSIGFIPFILFVIAGIMALATGTSWGSFGILLPLAGDIVATMDSSMLLPSLAAVLAGAVFGDHCSPISDTTILSSTGAGCNHMDHVMTQLPYALTSAFIAAIGFLMLGFTGSTILSLSIVVIMMVGALLFLAKKNKAADAADETKIA